MHNPSSADALVRSPGELARVAPPASAVFLPDLWHALRRQQHWYLLTPIVVALVVAFLTWRQQPEYESQATLLVGREASSGGFLAERMAAIAGLGGGAGGGSLQTELLILQSRQIVEEVVDSLALRVVLTRPNLPRSAVFSELATPTEEFTGKITLSRAGEDRYKVAAETPAGERVEAPAEVILGERFLVGGIELVLNPGLRDEAPAEIEVEVRSRRAAVRGVPNDLTVGRLAGANVVEITYRSTDPLLAAGVPNRMASAFIMRRQRMSQDESRGTIGFLRDQVAYYGTQLREAEARLQSFRERADLLNLPDAASRQVQRLSALEVQRTELVSERNVLTQLLGEAEISGAGSEEYRRLAAFPEFFRNPAVQDILRALVQLENRRSELLVQRTMENVDVQGLTGRIEELENQLHRIALNYLDSLEKQIAATDSTLARFGRENAKAPAQAAELVRLVREAKLLEEIYAQLTKQLKGEEVAEADARTDVSILDAALVPNRPVSPRPVRNLVLGILVGTILGGGIAVARAVLDPRLYSRDGFVAVAGLPLLGAIPAGSAPGSSRAAKRGRLPFRRAKERLQPALVSAAPQSAAAEAYRALRTRLRSSVGDSSQVLLVTSARSGNGKASVASNLALSFAQQGVRTLLIDADLRHGNVMTLLKHADRSPGLAQVLVGEAELHECVRPYPVEGTDAVLDLLAPGTVSQNLAELLGSPQMRALMEDLRHGYQVIIVDAPALTVAADAAILSELTDVTLLVAHMGSTHRRTLEDAAEQVRASGTRSYGLVITGVEAFSSAADS
jgi:tyrosine-protein kinase Etk/Wzc